MKGGGKVGGGGEMGLEKQGAGPAVAGQQGAGPLTTSVRQ